MRAHMTLVCGLLAPACSTHQIEPSVPLPSGTYQFHQLDDEFAESLGFPVALTIQGTHYTVTTPGPLCGGIAAGDVLATGVILWHRSTKEWILGDSKSDRDAPDVDLGSEGA